MNQRKIWLDALRIFACFNVIVNHTNLLWDESGIMCSKGELLVGCVYEALCKTAVGLFLMISGTLLLGKNESLKTVFTRIVRCCIVLLIFSFPFYIRIHGFNYIGYIQAVTRENMTTAYWYLYLYLGILIMLPFLRIMAQHMSFGYFVLFFIPAFLFNSVDSLSQYNTNFKLPIMATFIGIYFLGYFIEQYESVIFKKKLIYYLLTVVSILCILIVSYDLYHTAIFNPQDSPRLFCYDNIFYIIIDAWIYYTFKLIFNNHKVSELGGRLLREVSQLTFGIYLFSDLFINLFISNNHLLVCEVMNSRLISMILIEFIVFICGSLVTKILKRIPIINRLL